MFASHSQDLLRKWCNRGVLLHQGRVAASGGVDEVIAAYMDTLHIRAELPAQL